MMREEEKVQCGNRTEQQCEESPGSRKVLQAALVQRALRGYSMKWDTNMTQHKESKT